MASPCLPFLQKNAAKTEPPLINMGTDTCRVLCPRSDTNECCQEVQAPRGGQVVVLAAAWLLREVWIVSKVYADKVQETARGTEGNGESTDSCGEASFKSAATQAAWPFDLGWRQREYRPGSVNLSSSTSWALKSAVFHRCWWDISCLARALAWNGSHCNDARMAYRGMASNPTHFLGLCRDFTCKQREEKES